MFTNNITCYVYLYVFTSFSRKPHISKRAVCALPRAVASSIIGGGTDIHIFVFTNHKNNRFQKKLTVQNLNIWISTPQLSSWLQPWLCPWERITRVVHVVWETIARIWFNKIVRRNTQETVRNNHSFSVIRATIAFYIAIQLDEYFKLTLGFRAR